MITLEQEMIYRLRVDGPLLPHDDSPPNEGRQWWEMSAASLDWSPHQGLERYAGI